MQGYKHDGTTRTPNSTWVIEIVEDSDWLPANDPCTLELGSVWRLPTLTEWTNVDASGGWTNGNGPWNSSLKMHQAGRLDIYGGFVDYRGSGGYYWSSSQYDIYSGWLLDFDSGGCNVGFYYERPYGFSGRCLRD